MIMRNDVVQLNALFLHQLRNRILAYVFALRLEFLVHPRTAIGFPALRMHHENLLDQFRPALSFTIDVNNLTNAPQAAYRGIPDQMQFKLYGGTTITAGVNGRF